MEHILDAIKNIENFSFNKTKEQFYDDLMYRFSVERQLEIIGEAANNITPSMRELRANVPWQKIISLEIFWRMNILG